MKLSDKELGMDRAISRRDFLNGTATIIAAVALPGSALTSGGGSARVTSRSNALQIIATEE